MKTQVLLIHGGETFETYDEYISFLKSYKIESLDYFKGHGWSSSLQQNLGENFEVIAPRMLNKFNAKYLEWKIYFNKIVPLLNPEVVLVGRSLGGIFLTKYLSENNFPKKIKSVFLVAPPYDAEETDYKMADFVLENDLQKISEQSSNINFYFSKDDTVVPILNMEKYKKLLPNAKYHIFEDRGHFWQEEFPELVQDILETI